MLSSHQLAEVQEICSHIAIIDHGKLVASGPLKEIVGDAGILEVGVDRPEAALQLLAALPDVAEIERIEEPVIVATIHVPQEYVGPVLSLCQERRGNQRDMTHAGGRVQVSYELPLAEVVLDFHDRIKSVTRGYGSFDYDWLGYRPSDLVKLDVLVNGEPVDALSLIVHREKSYQRGTELVRKLKEYIPRQQFEVALQAAIGARVIARSTVKALRKNVTAKCYGGDISRKRKLLEKQKEGKRRMKKVGSVEIPQEAFLAALRLGDS